MTRLDIVPALRMLTLRTAAALSMGANGEINKRKNPLAVGPLNGLPLGERPIAG